VFTVSLSAPSTQAVSVHFATADAGASAGTDYQAVAGTLTIPAGQTTGTITVLVNGDRLPESNETFFVDLSSPTDAIIADGRGVGTTVDDEPWVTLNDLTVTEGNAGTVNATFTVRLSVAYDIPVTVHYDTADGTATAGSDYVAAAGDVIVAAGQTTAPLPIAVIGDRSPEFTENFVVNVRNTTNAYTIGSWGTGTILDNDNGPRISISDVSKKEGKKNQTTQFTFTVTLSAAYDQAVTMSYRTVDGTAKTSDTDYVAKTGTLTFAPGETTKTITITVNGDNKREAIETFSVDLFGLSGNAMFSKSRGIGTILNDD
jgi:Calx-beta domain